MKIIFLTVFAFLALQLQAQEATVSSGGDLSGSGGSVSYTIGQVSYNYYSGSNGNISEGVQQIEIEPTTSLDENQFDIDFNLYPNPASDHIIVETADLSNLDDANYNMYNSEGKIVTKGGVSTTTTLVDISELPKSTYYLKIIVDDQIVKSFKIIKN
ncbi:MAG: T9SS type A sorting domain-containing protein [Brumimicrobium sp.]